MSFVVFGFHVDGDDASVFSEKAPPYRKLSIKPKIKDFFFLRFNELNLSEVVRMGNYRGCIIKICLSC